MLVGLVAAEDVAGVDLGLYVIELRIVAVGDYCIAELLETGEVIDNEAAKEGAVVGQ